MGLREERQKEGKIEACNLPGSLAGRGGKGAEQAL